MFRIERNNRSQKTILNHLTWTGEPWGSRTKAACRLPPHLLTSFQDGNGSPCPSLSLSQSALLPGQDDGCLKATHLEPKACSCLATLPKIAAERNWQPRSQDDNVLHGLVSCASLGCGLDSMYCPVINAVSPKCQIHWPFWH